MKIDFFVTPIFLIALAGLVLVHQYLVSGGIWFQWEDVHHEMFIVALGFGAVVAFWYRKKLL